MRALVLFTVIAAIVVSCSSGNSEEKNSDSAAAACKPKPVNPNGDSELAIIMREMAEWTEACKAAIESNGAIPGKPQSIERIHTAKRTDETIDASMFNSMATLYEGAVQSFITSDTSKRVTAFNAMVSACAGCHENFCHGPLVRINKMTIAR